MDTVIGVDWGTTNGRAMRLQNGAIIEQRNLETGASLPQHIYASTLTSKIGDWIIAYPKAPIVLCGMVGAREAWTDAGYMDCPAQLIDLVRHSADAALGERTVTIISGLRCPIDDEAGFDVMRGEETQVLGTLSKLNINAAIFCLPGTHSKWVEIKDGNVQTFKTYMTGDVFSAVSSATILSRSLVSLDVVPDDHFKAGVYRARAGGALLSNLFTARTTLLAGITNRKDQTAYLSGMLIGHELRDALERFDAGHVVLIGDLNLTRLYRVALECFGVTFDEVDGDCAVAKGLWRFASQYAELEECR